MRGLKNFSKINEKKFGRNEKEFLYLHPLYERVEREKRTKVYKDYKSSLIYC
ncbi:hypothetical protein P278_00010 [Zhouia amylolytica AD3]|uniref:Uncharacterized protein n=1 Tax=Zhouia amylolytica AD3 TaxID=1286632 RepID=W2UQY4_9FLAO|nr:hypothetical protein P278_00010 [Zhouia amylolytica AD3]